jgi:hypothetical protein
MSKPKLIRSADLDVSNRNLLAAAQQVGLDADEIIRQSVKAAYCKLLPNANGSRAGRPTRVARRIQDQAFTRLKTPVSKPIPKTVGNGGNVENRRLRA